MFFWDEDCQCVPHFYRLSDLFELRSGSAPLTQPQQDHEHFNRTLEIAKDSLNTPRPLTPRLPVYGKSRLRDEKLTEQIEDLTKRRRIVRISLLILLHYPSMWLNLSFAYAPSGHRRYRQKTNKSSKLFFERQG